MAVRVDPELHHRIRVHAAESGQTIQDVVEVALDKAIPKQKVKKA